MDKTSILLLINSLLLAIISILFLVIGYFLKDLHKDFKTLIERVNTLYTDLYSHIHLFDAMSQNVQQKLMEVEKKVAELAHKVLQNNNNNKAQ